MLADFRYALRLLGRAPGFTAAVVIVLALGIGANSAIFTLLDRTVLRPLPYAEPDRLAILWEDFSAFGTLKQRVSPGTFSDWRKRTQTFEAMGAWGGSTMDLSGGGPPEQVDGQRVTANLLPLLGVGPLLGRTFTTEEERPGTHVVVLSYRLWQRRFNGDAKILGNSILMNGEKYTVAGVMPRSFHFPDSQTEYWVPLALDPQMLMRRNSHVLHVAGRLKPGRDLKQAQADMSRIAAELATEYPVTNGRIGIQVVSLKKEVLGDTSRVFTILLVAAACVLLIACANVAHLLLARAAVRQNEVAVRIALGASASRILRQIVTENLVLAFAGGALGLVAAHWTMSLLQTMVPAGLAGSVDLKLDSTALAFAGLLSVVCGFLLAGAPMRQLLKSSLYEGSRGGVSPAGGRLRDVLVVAEVAIALVLVVGAALLIETIAKLRVVDPGFRSGSILTAEIAVPLPKYASSVKRQRFYSDLLARVRALPGVQSAGLTSDLPYTSRGNTMSLTIEGQAKRADLGQDALFRLVSAGYLQTIGAKLKAGRFLEPSDGPDTTPVVVINEKLARQYWPNENPIGRRIDTGTGGGSRRWMTVAGVVADIRERGLDFDIKPAVYVPFLQTEISFFQPSEIAVYTARNPQGLAKELQAAVWSVDAEQPVSNIRTMDAIVDEELSNRTQVLNLLGAFAGLALLLAAIGIYGLLSYAVSQRTREIGLRMAIGATRWDITRTVVVYAARLAGGGLIFGIIGAMAATRMLRTLLYEVSPLEPTAFASVAALLMLVAIAAAIIPARRAASVDPLTALRNV